MLPRSPSTVTVAELRQREFSRLDARDEAYLDYTGSGLAFESHLRWHLELLRTEVFGNPHSENPPSLASTHWVTEARAAVLAFVDADPAEYEVVFTANASAAIKLVGESFPLEPSSRLVLTADNHNSVLGIREFARRAGASVSYVPLDDDLRLHGAGQALGETARGSASLFAYPAQSNFSGVRHPLTLVPMAHSLGYAVLLDAAAFVPTARLSLRDVPADFVTLSFYKVFGYPTGVGALVARREWLERLRRPWFAGGTVEFASVQNDVHLLRRGAEGFEDGTPNFLALSAVSWGLARIADIGVDRIGEHVKTMAGRLLEGLRSLRHASGSPLVTVYGPQDMEARGGTVAFNLIDSHGRWIPHADVEARAAARRVSVRSGCFCNPGAGEQALRFDAGQVASCVAGARDDTRHPRFSKDEFARCMGDTPIGAVRASVGIGTTERDVERLLESLNEWRS